MPSWEIDICGAAEVRRAPPVFADPVLRESPVGRPGAEETRLLELWHLAGASGVVKDLVADEVVSFAATPSASGVEVHAADWRFEIACNGNDVYFPYMPRLMPVVGLCVWRHPAKSASVYMCRPASSGAWETQLTMA